MHNAITARRRVKLVALCVVVVVLASLFLLTRQPDKATPRHSDSQSGSEESGQKTPQQPFDASAHSLTDPTSIWVIVNKSHPLNPKNYVPSLTVPDVPLKGGTSAANMHVSTVMAPALASLFSGAKAASLTLMLSSGYRSYSYQVGVYNGIVRSQGQAAADKQSARPGYSEHQTGLAADVAPRSGRCDLSQCFGATSEGSWLAANAYKYGFIIRYPSNKESVTGYEYEPWHIRYVGVELSTEMHNRGIETLEEFFRVAGGTTYH
jgi:D-alanyl-D-alanine carboxypeptidase